MVKALVLYASQDSSGFETEAENLTGDVDGEGNITYTIVLMNPV